MSDGLTLPLRRNLAHRLPEESSFRDTGCDYHPACLSCPLPVCRHDIEGGLRQAKLRQRDAAIRRAWEDEALTVKEIAERFTMSKRAVYRVVARQRTIKEG